MTEEQLHALHSGLSEAARHLIRAHRDISGIPGGKNDIGTAIFIVSKVLGEIDMAVIRRRDIDGGERHPET